MPRFFHGWRQKLGGVVIVVAVTIVISIGICGFLGMALEEPGMLYTVTAEFQQLPDSDEELKQWLCQQSGVINAFWSCPQVTRDGNRVTVSWHHGSTWPKDPVTPTLREQFGKFGYRGGSKYQETKRKEAKEWS